MQDQTRRTIILTSQDLIIPPDALALFALEELPAASSWRTEGSTLAGFAIVVFTAIGPQGQRWITDIDSV